MIENMLEKRKLTKEERELTRYYDSYLGSF